MRRAGSAGGISVWIAALAVITLAAAVVVLPRVAPGPVRPPTAVTRTRPPDLRRQRDVRFTNEYLYDSSYETCDALGIRSLARKLGVPAARPARVARAFARQNYPPATRSGPYHGCVDALLDRRKARRRQ
jgi:hypothetical protein